MKKWWLNELQCEPLPQPTVLKKTKEKKSSIDFIKWSEKGHSEAIFNQKRSCLPPRRVTERALSDAGERRASTQPLDRTSLICLWSGGGRSDKGQGFGCDKERPYVLLRPWLSPWLSIARGHPEARSWPQPGKPPRWCFRTQVWIWPCAVRYTESWCVFTCGSFGAVKERKVETETEGQVEFRADFFCQSSHTAGKPNCFRI